MAIDWAGSGNGGWRNISSQPVVASVRYGTGDIATSAVGGCSEQNPQGTTVSVVAAGTSTKVALGSRCDGYGRMFKGLVYEVVVFNRSLTDAEHAAVVESLAAKHTVAPVDCSARPKFDLNCTDLRSTCASGSWPRKCGLAANETARLNAFLAKVGASPELNATVPAAMARASLDAASAYEARCAGLVNGTIPSLASRASVVASLGDLLSTSGNLFVGLANVLSGRYAQSEEPLAVAVVKAWEDSTLSL